ncbi:MAG: 6-phosphogluconolactonase [Thermoleophilia bacterium]|nr:6-phosphogluconolactonase [Thermoleophilia bacterium]
MRDDAAMTVEFVVTEDAEAAAAAAAALVVEVVVAGGSIVLAGGSTPRRAYELAAELHSDWGDAEVWFGDDRCVPPADPRSNQLLVREALLERLVVPPTVRAIPTALIPEAAAALYDAALTGETLDLVLLGLGPDGHTAALFPDAPSLSVTDRLAVVAEPGLEPFVQRITLTIPALEAGRHVVFLAVGEGKAIAVRNAFGEEPSHSTPASLVRSREGRTTVILDEAAASLLREGGTGLAPTG